MDANKKFTTLVISKDIKFFTRQILKTYPHLKLGYDPNKPAIFFGIYRQEDVFNIIHHKSYGLIILGGSDSMKKPVLQFLSQIDKRRFYVIAQSKYISDDLKTFNIRHVQKPWYSLNKNMFKPTIKGNKIYIYMPKPWYGKNIFDKMKPQLEKKYKIIVGNGKFKYEDMPYIYSQCFIGLRLVPHDGLGSTVQELGLMGIKCVHNGGAPSALSYNSIADIINHIDSEYKTVGTKDIGLSSEVNNYLQINEDFFLVSTYFH